MRILFFGTSAFAVPSLEQLVAHHHTIIMCVTQPDRPQGRGLHPEPSPVKGAAVRLGVPLLQAERLDVKLFEEPGLDVGVVVAYGELITCELLGLPTHGMLGVHPSLLPKYRGAAPIAWALLNGETMTGVTIFRLNESLDAGDILCQQALIIEPDECAETLSARLAQLGAQELLRALGLLAINRAVFTHQDDTQASFAPKLTKAHGWIDWNQPADVIARLVRATVPWPGATTEWQGRLLKVWAASVADRGAVLRQGEPGTVLDVGADAMTVATGQGALLVKELQVAGARRMSVREFLAGHCLNVGDRFGT